jgi:hypothetical protein
MWLVRRNPSIAIAPEFFWVSVMVVFMVACGLQKIYTQPGQLQEFRPPEGRDNLQLANSRRK